MVSAQDVAGRKSDTGTDEQKQAAQMIQRNYRGYRERRQLQGMGLDASARWAEAIRDGQQSTPISTAPKLNL